MEEEEEEDEGLVERKLLRHEMAICLATPGRQTRGVGSGGDDERGSQI